MAREGYAIPLTLALIYAAAHSEELVRTYDGQPDTRALGDLFGTVARHSARVEESFGGHPTD